jgi:hypothetical protein
MPAGGGMAGCLTAKNGNYAPSKDRVPMEGQAKPVITMKAGAVADFVTTRLDGARSGTIAGAATTIGQPISALISNAIFNINSPVAISFPTGFIPNIIGSLTGALIRGPTGTRYSTAAGGIARITGIRNQPVPDVRSHR